MVVVVGIAVLAGAGCSSGPEKGDAGSPPASTPTPVALSVPMYQRALTNVEKVLKPYVARVMSAPSLPAFDATRAQLAAAVVLERKELARITPPRGLVVAHPAVLDAFDSYSGSVSTNLSEAGVTKTSCGLPKAPVVRLYQAKTGVRTAFATLAQGVQKSIGKGVKFGALAVPAAPKAPSVINGRGTNGQVVQRSGSRGAGTLKITNNSSNDVVIVVTNNSPRSPQASIYVRANHDATLNGIRGSYWVYFKSGTSWDAANRRFTEGCAYEKYDDNFDGAFKWTISLAQTPLGNAPTSETEAF